MAIENTFPEIGQSYIGPMDQVYRVLDIEGPPSGLQWVVIGCDKPGHGTIRFPIWDAKKWLAPLPQPQD